MVLSQRDGCVSGDRGQLTNESDAKPCVLIIFGQNQHSRILQVPSQQNEQSLVDNSNNKSENMITSTSLFSEELDKQSFDQTI